MSGSVAARLCAGGRRVACLYLIAPCFAACSLSAPTVADYAKPRPVLGQAGQGSGDAGVGGDSGGAASFAGNGGVSAMASGGKSGSAGDTTLGDAGWTGDVVLGDAIARSDVALEPVSTFSRLNLAALTDYDADEATAAQTTPPRNTPLYTPYDSTTLGWWDNLVAEQTQARLPFVLLPTHGAYSLTAADLTGPDAMNPRRLSAWVSALDRAGSSSLFLAGCFVDMASMQSVRNNFHSAAPGTLMDLSSQSDWDNVIWRRMIQPWFDTIPKVNWYKQADGPLIQFGSVSASSFKNLTGNLSNMLSSVAASFHDAYNISPSYVLDASWFAAEPTLRNNRYVVGENSLTAPPAASSFTSYHNLSLGALLASYADPAYYQVGGASYHDPALLIPRKAKDAYGTTVITLDTGLAAATMNASTFTIVQGFSDVDHWSGLYRSEAPEWATPNEYLNLLRRYSDPKTVTVRLEAEGCDKFLNTTPGNSGAAFRRSGDLDVRAFSGGGGWSVTNTAAGEWVEFDGVYFSPGNYQLVAKYSTSSASSEPKRIQPLIDGERFTPVIAPNTANADTFANVQLLSPRFVSQGPHDLRVRFVDGLVDLDWLFVKKTDLRFSLQAAGGGFVSANNGGGAGVDTLALAADVYEQLTFIDINGGSLEDGDSVYLQVWNGMFLSAAAGKLKADQQTAASAETFTVHSATGNVADGARVALLSNDKTHYVTVGVGSVIDSSGAVIGDAQLFTLGQY